MAYNKSKSKAKIDVVKSEKRNANISDYKPAKNLASQKSILKGTLVWAKFLKYPWWPGNYKSLFIIIYTFFFMHLVIHFKYFAIINYFVFALNHSKQLLCRGFFMFVLLLLRYENPELYIFVFPLAMVIGHQDVNLPAPKSPKHYWVSWFGSVTVSEVTIYEV